MKLSTRHHRAIVALLKYPTIKAAAKEAGCTERAIYLWLNDTDFKRELAQAEAQAVAAAARQIAQGSQEAVTILRAILRNSEATIREKQTAANSLLAHTPKLRLLGSLEQAIEELKRGNNDNT